MGFETGKEHKEQPAERLTEGQSSRAAEAEERFVDYVRKMSDPDQQDLRDDYRRKAVVEGIHIVTVGSPDRDSHPITRVSRRIGADTARPLLDESAQEFLRRLKSQKKTPDTAERPLLVVDFQRKPDNRKEK